MSLFDQIRGAIDNPNQQASSSQLGTILDAVQQLSSNHNTDLSTVQSAASIVGKYVRSSLQQKRESGGEQQAQEAINQYSGTGSSDQAVQSLFSDSQIQQISQEVEKRTGLSAETVPSMLPKLVPLVLKFLGSGSNTQNPQGSHSVLSGFLDVNGDGETDFKDAMQMASRYLNR